MPRIKSEMEKLFELYENTPRQGPGLDETTVEIYRSLASKLPEKPLILDIGCGTEAQTLALAKVAPDANIIATDVHQPYLEALKIHAEHAGVADRITPRIMSMMEPDIEHGSIDLIWCEGAIFIMGLEEGLRAWHSMLRFGGYAVISELSWIKPNPPQEIADYWEGEYPKIADIADNTQRCRNAGYQVLETKILPSVGWLENFYLPLEKRIVELRESWHIDEESALLDATLREIDIYRKYGEWYGYVFYILKKA